MEFDTIAEFHEAVKQGNIDETALRIVLDNDATYFNSDIVGNIKIKQANGYYDVEHLYRLLFPKATIEWC